MAVKCFGRDADFTLFFGCHIFFVCCFLIYISIYMFGVFHRVVARFRKGVVVFSSCRLVRSAILLVDMGSTAGTYRMAHLVLSIHSGLGSGDVDQLYRVLCLWQGLEKYCVCVCCSLSVCCFL